MRTTGRYTYIYGLFEPDGDYLRYIGKSNNPDKRFKTHISASERENTYKSKWIKSLRKNNQLPVLKIIEKVRVIDWEESEKFYIAYFKFIGCTLTPPIFL